MNDLKNFTDSDGRKVEQSVIRKILKVICDKKATYASEVSSYVDADPSNIGSILRQLEESGVLEELTPKMKHGDPRLRDAVLDSQFSGIEEAKNPRWYGLNSDVDWELKVNGKDMWVDEYHRVIEDPEGVDKNLLDYAVDKMA